MLGDSFAQTIRAARQEIARGAQVQQAPRVIWAGCDESTESFAARCAEIRARWRGRIMAAVPFGFAAPDGVYAVPFAPKLFRLLHPDHASRYRCASGGRGSAKSHSFATAIVLLMLSRRLRILAAREIMRSLRESVHHLLSDKIEALGLMPFFEINDREIRCVTTNSEVIFAGLMANVQQLRSLEGISLVWCEEAESISAESLMILIPTIREVGSEIWLSANPDKPDAPVQEQFIDGVRPDVAHVHVTFADNPFFPSVLEAERLYLQRVDDDAYRHVWLGETRKISEAQVLRGRYVVEEFEPVLPAPIGHWRDTSLPKPWDGPYFGVDFGYSSDPSAMVKLWISGRTLYVSHEAYGVGIEVDQLPSLFDRVPGSSKHASRADSARPETISYLQRHGYPRMVAAKKGPGSVEDGVEHLRSYERIVIHPRCTHAVEEARLWSYKVDRVTGDVLPQLVGRHDHIWDAARYALEPAIRRRRGITIQPLRI